MKRLTFIYHSCFCLELDSCQMIFDYWKGELPELDPDKPLYVFSSHNHHDHFNPDIFKLKEKYSRVKFILSDDIQTPDSGDILWVKEHQDYICDNLKIRTFHSTDQGVAFYVEAAEMALIHFGDLNWWHWEGESDAFNHSQKSEFMHEIDLMKDLVIDVAMGPALDERLKPNHWFGMDWFLKNTAVKKVFPMHFFNKVNFTKTALSQEPLSQYKDRIMLIEHKNQVFDLD